MEKKKLAVVWLSLVMLFSFIGFVVDMPQSVKASMIWVDDSYPSEDPTHKKTIQAGVDAASPGDTVYVYSGIYYENVEINKIITLTGESRDSVIINGSGSGTGIYVNNADYTNISEFTVEDTFTGISLYLSDNSIIKNNKAEKHSYGIIVNSCNNTVIEGNIVSNSTGNYDGIHLTLSTNITVKKNICHNLGRAGVWVQGCSNINVLDNYCNKNNYGVYLTSSYTNQIHDNTVNSNSMYGIAILISDNNYLINNTLSNNFGSVKVMFNLNNTLINSTIKDSISYDIQLTGNAYLTLINTSFNKLKTIFSDTNSKLEVKWYLHINVTNSFGQPMPNTDVCIKDKQNSLPAQKYTTDFEGYIRWLTQTEYIEQDTNGNIVGEKTYYTPHRITAWNETLMGYAEVNIDESKEVNIVPDTPYYEIPLTAGWNLISFPLVQSDTDISTVLSSIAGNYGIVQWYNANDGTWHSTNDDLTDINHTMGFWIHMKTADTLIVNGTIPNTTSIQLYQGWNLVGNPSFCIHGIDDILSPIATKYTAVQQYDSWDGGDPWKHYHINKPQNLNDLAYMTSGRGYWLYVTEDVVWEVSNF
jgi:parallel beta-helix repeat protein